MSTFPPPRHHKASGQARVRYHGRDYYLGRYGSPEAARAYADLVARLASGEPSKPRICAGGAHNARICAHTVADVVARYEASELPAYPASSHTPAKVRRALLVVVRLYGTLPAASFGAAELSAVQLAMASGSWLTDAERADLADARKPVGWSRLVVNRAVIRVRTCWRWAERHGLVPAGAWNALRCVPGLRETDRRVRHLPRRQPATWADVEAVLPHLPRVGRAMVLVQWWTGMRSGEVRSMRAGEVDTTGDVWLYRPSSHKGTWRGGERVVAVGPQAQAILAPWLAGKGPGDAVFPPSRRRGRETYSEAGYAQMVRRAAQRAGVALQPYQLRHSAKRRAERECGTDAARAMLGHATVDATRHYASEQDVETAVRVARRVG